MLFTTPAIEEYISGVILFDETMRQKTKEGILFPEFLTGRGIIPGIKVDQGLEPFNNSEIEKVTKGLEGLPERLADYVKMGAGFTKWRAVINIKDNELPTDACILESAKRLAQYAVYSQEAGLVPIVEPEVLLDGNHTIEKCKEVVKKVTKEVFNQLKLSEVYLPGLILKSSMVLSGKENPIQAGLQEVAKMTIDALKNSAPEEVAGIVFLSGGQEDELATARLNEINKFKNLGDAGEIVWPLTFSFGRGLQDKPMKTWKGLEENILIAKKEFYDKCKANSLACQGKL
jgi:fructose-bisphosphate aldolase class I